MSGKVRTTWISDDIRTCPEKKVWNSVSGKYRTSLHLLEGVILLRCLWCFFFFFVCVCVDPSNAFCMHRRIAGVCFELHFRVTPGQFRSAAASSLNRRLALLATSTRPSFSKNAYLGILFAPMYQKYSLDFVSFVFHWGHTVSELMG